MATATLCDRCRREMTAPILTLEVRAYTGMNPRRRELCQSCAEGFAEWDQRPAVEVFDVGARFDALKERLENQP